MAKLGTIILRPASFTDMELLLSWRNDPETRRQSKSMAKVSIVEHEIWMRDVLDNPNIRLQIAILDGEAVGNIRANKKIDFWELSWAIDLNFRGQNLGYQMVLKAIEELEGTIRAEVKPDNLASIRITEKLGMECLGVEGGVMVWELTK